jgi:glycosyltransferase involved in cell wall biosynthesis
MLQSRFVTPKVSIVMPVYEGIATLDRSLLSVTAQSYSDWELLAADDGSADGE